MLASALYDLLHNGFYHTTDGARRSIAGEDLRNYLALQELQRSRHLVSTMATCTFVCLVTEQEIRTLRVTRGQSNG